MPSGSFPWLEVGMGMGMGRRGGLVETEKTRDAGHEIRIINDNNDNVAPPFVFANDRRLRRNALQNVSFPSSVVRIR
jgi:hypothetical protein